MAKDPAFLFYPSDFIMGCSDLTMEERGQYITLLCLQHQKGVLTKKSIGLNLGLSFDNLSEDLQSKFIVEDENTIYNVRLNSEIEKRKKFTEKQRENGKKGGRPRKDSPIEAIEKKLLKTSQKEPQTESNESELSKGMSPDEFFIKLEAGEIETKSNELKTQQKPNPKPKLKAKAKPNKSLLENRDKDINEVKEESKKGVKGKKEIVVNPELEMPEEFKPLWAEWIEYKVGKKASFKYAGTKFEQIAVNRLLAFSDNDVNKANDILQFTFFRNWEGFRAYDECKDQILKFKKETGLNGLSNGEFESNR